VNISPVPAVIQQRQNLGLQNLGLLESVVERNPGHEVAW
jgi:hypothetical protein